MVIFLAGDRYDYLQIRYADIHADISADIYLLNFVHIGISADISSICRYGPVSADIALYLQIWYVLQIYIEWLLICRRPYYLQIWCISADNLPYLQITFISADYLQMQIYLHICSADNRYLQICQNASIGRPLSTGWPIWSGTIFWWLDIPP